jgi:homoserine O-acetyltransferase/O-succinyltransferase
MKSLISIFFALFFTFITLNAQSEQQFAELGNFKLVSGETIYKCKIGYRTFGTLNADKTNAVLYPTWFGGKSESLANLIGPDKVVDSDEYFVIAVDALGNGVSSSPSNCEYQSNRNFPEITIKDMVNSQYTLLTEHLGIQKLHGMIGGSMGGMQVFEWIVSYPEFMGKAIAYVGSPKLTSFDLLLWQTELNAIEEGWKCDQSNEEVVKTIAAIQNMMARTPAYVIEKTKPEEVPHFLSSEYNTYSKIFNSYNWALQLKAMMSHDISKNFNGSMKEAASKVKTKLFIIVSSTDLVVNPNPAIEFANLIGVSTHIFENNCGHLAPGCEMETFKKLISDFLDG